MTRADKNAMTLIYQSHLKSLFLYFENLYSERTVK